MPPLSNGHFALRVALLSHIHLARVEVGHSGTMQSTHCDRMLTYLRLGIQCGKSREAVIAGKFAVPVGRLFPVLLPCFTWR